MTCYYYMCENVERSELNNENNLKMKYLCIYFEDKKYILIIRHFNNF